MDGSVVVPTYDWTSFLAEHVDRCVGIKALHHLRFPSTHRGQVLVRERSDSLEHAVTLLKDEWSPLPSDLPQLISPSGLSLNRQWYLHNKIREYCPDEWKDLTCPEPCRFESTSTRATTPSPTTVETTASPERSTLVSVSSSMSTSSVTTPSSTSALMNTSSSEASAPAPKRPRHCRICKGAGHNSRSCPSKT